ncbi:MAG: chromate efflux transporter [Solirubrobacteraceae bacterium MAG38_C4-C5]|nr:chromate efflux transporter [Candidatus Siliceabacter maunaloa]
MDDTGAAPPSSPSLRTVLREWGRIGCVGFGGPPAHIALLRDLCVARERWISEEEFEHGIAATNLLPGPASTQLAVFCAWRLRGVPGALVGGLAFILPGLAAIIALAALFLGAPPDWVLGVGAGAGAVVAAVAVQAGASLLPAGWARTAGRERVRFVAYVVLGAAATVLVGVWLALVLVACGFAELTWRRAGPRAPTAGVHAWPVALLLATAGIGGLGALAWTAFKVGALSYGGGFVIIPLMQADAVGQGWMTDGEFLNAVALGQATPGPVVHTVAVVGYAAAGVGGALLAAVVAFAPSFWFIILGADRFDRLRASPAPQAFLRGAGPAAIGAIIGSAVPLTLALSEAWQVGVLAGGAALLLVARRGVVLVLVLAACAGALAAVAGAPLPR